ncbi:hypothetical protein D9M68_566660 [compost metagenome]
MSGFDGTPSRSSCLPTSDASRATPIASARDGWRGGTSSTGSPATAATARTTTPSPGRHAIHAGNTSCTPSGSSARGRTRPRPGASARAPHWRRYRAGCTPTGRGAPSTRPRRQWSAGRPVQTPAARVRDRAIRWSSRKFAHSTRNCYEGFLQTFAMTWLRRIGHIPAFLH